MKRILTKKMIVLILAVAMVQVLVIALAGSSSGSTAARAVKTAGAAEKVRFDDTEILKSSLLERYTGNRWRLMGSFTCLTRNECLGCDILLQGTEPAKVQPSLPFIRVMLMTTPVDSNDEVHEDTLTALRVTVGSTRYSFNCLEMKSNGFAYISCGNTAREMLADLAGCNRATFEVDYVQYGTGKKGTFTTTVTRARLNEWRKMASLLENSHIWEAVDSFTLHLEDEGAVISRR